MASLENFRLVVFQKVAEHLSFRKAAEELYLSQPAVSLQIKALEEELNAPLFDRSGTRPQLTPGGEILLRYARQSGEILQRAMNEIAAASGTFAGELKLGASTTIAQYVLPRLLARFCGEHPRVRPSLLSGNTEQIVACVERREISLGLIEGPPRTREVHVQPFLADELVLIVPVAHEWAERGTIAAAELKTAPLLMRERGSGTRHIAELALEKAGIPRGALNVVMELDSTEAIKSSVEAGLGVGLVSRWAIVADKRADADFRTVAIENLRIVRDFLLIAPKAPEMQGLAAEFRDFVLMSTRPKEPPVASGAKPAGAKPARAKKR
jgi:DNA-binding transcriptional LysR family regulator